MPLLPPPEDTDGWRAPRLRSLLLRRRRPAAGFVTALRAPAAPAVVVLAVFAAVGVAVLDDYGMSWDEPAMRNLAVVVEDYVFGDGALLTDSTDSARYYGISFEAPLLLAERLLGLTDSRDVHLLRHLLTHLFFLAGGFFCWLLARRLFADRPVRPAAVPAPSPAVRPLVLQQQGRPVPGHVHDRCGWWSAPSAATRRRRSRCAARAWAC